MLGGVTFVLEAFMIKRSQVFGLGDKRSMKWLYWLMVCVGLMVSGSGFADGKKVKTSAAPIREEMGGLFVALSDLLPIVLNKAAFEDPKNAQEILSLMNRLQDLSLKMVTSTRKFADNDPGIPFVAERFSNDITMALDMWKSGDRVVPRRLLRGVTDYCISCHTRTSKGLHLSAVTQPSRLKTMPSLAKAEYLAATRQFHDALKIYEDALVHKPLAKIDPDAWDSGVRKMLAIAVRVENKPRLAMELLSSIQNSPDNMPPALREDIAMWRQSAKSWANEEKQPKMTNDEKFALAKRLLGEGETIASKSPGGELIQYLRASSLLHEILGKVPSSQQSQEMLWLAGQSAEHLRELNLWTMQDVYYEACARKNQDSRLSLKCYNALENSMVKAYGVASRAGLPQFAKNQLDDLKRVIKIK